MNSSHQEGSEREDEDKWAGGDPPFPFVGEEGGNGLESLFYVVILIPT